MPGKKFSRKTTPPSSPVACDSIGGGACGAAYWGGKTEAQWRALLTPEQYRIARQAGTERAFTGKYWNTETPGVYRCACCSQALFRSESKFDSGTGWPSFQRPITPEAVIEQADHTHGLIRIEVKCARCAAHLGHMFEDGPPPDHRRYCMNSAVLMLVPDVTEHENGASRT